MGLRFNFRASSDIECTAFHVTKHAIQIFFNLTAFIFMFKAQGLHKRLRFGHLGFFRLRPWFFAQSGIFFESSSFEQILQTMGLRFNLSMDMTLSDAVEFRNFLVIDHQRFEFVI